ncbi:MAG: TonB-dependent receptor [Halioglobus sp.]|nr:TonB-dependent receptor [Halioglobus sp.]
MISVSSGRYLPRLIALSLVSATPQALAQVNGLEEIIVTANKREASLMDSAASISAFDAATLNQLGITDAQDLVAHTPSLSITTFRVSIRGVGRPNLAVGSEPGIGIYWDGVYNSENDVFGLSEFMDIERIEILRGPQGILYGRNSVGGAISFISKRPNEEWGGTATGQLTNYDGRLIQALASGPVTDKLKVLVGASYISHEGYQENIYNGKDYQEQETPYGTFSLEHQTTDRWNTVIKVLGTDQDYRPTNGYILEPFSRELNQVVQDDTTGAPISLPGMFPAQNFVNMRQGLAIENPAVDNEDKVKQDYDPSLKIRRWATFINSEYSADTYALKYTGGFSRYWFDSETDADASAAEDSGVDWSKLLFFGIPISNFPDSPGYDVTPAEMVYAVNQEATFDSHELQYTSEWDSDYSLLAGLYYYHSDEEQVVSFREWNDELMEMYAFFGANFVNNVVSDDNYLYRGDAHVDTRSYASYSQLSWDWTPETVLTVGLRYSYDEKKGSDNTFVQFVGDPSDPTVYRKQDDTWDKWTWRLGIDHFVTPEQFLYAFVATGYRSGGFNFQKPTASPLVDVVKPEEIISYEVGYKGSMLQNRLNLAASAYYYDYTDLQVIKQDVENGIALNTFENADDARAMGLEMEVWALPIPEVMLSATYSYNNTEFKDFSSKDANACTLGPYAQGDTQSPLCTDEQDLSGNEFALTPENKVSLNATYFWELFDLDWSITGSYSYQGEQWMTPFNNPLYDKVDSWDRWDARLTAATPEQEWEVTAFIKNITDDREIIMLGRPSTVTQNAQTTLTDPRIYGVKLQYNF